MESRLCLQRIEPRHAVNKDDSDTNEENRSSEEIGMSDIIFLFNDTLFIYQQRETQDMYKTPVERRACCRKNRERRLSREELINLPNKMSQTSSSGQNRRNLPIKN